MKFFTLDKTVLMVVSTVRPHENGILLEGKIMGTMPMKALLTPAELRAGLRFLSVRLIWKCISMLVAPRAK